MDKQSAQARSAHTGDERGLGELLRIALGVVARGRIRFAAMVALGLVCGILLAVCIPPVFTTHATVVPSTGSPGLLASQSGLSRLAGFSMPSTGNDRVIPDIAESDRVLSEILKADYRDTTFAAAFEEEYEPPRDRPDSVRTESMLKRLRENIGSSVDGTTGVITMRLRGHDPELITAALNRILRQVDHYFQHQMKSEARNKRQVLEQRVRDMADSLRIAEERLIRFREENRDIAMSPRLRQREQRMVREVDLLASLYLGVVQSHERSRLEEIGSTPVLNVLDRAKVPYQRTGPSRVRIVGVFLVLGILTGYVLAYLTDRFGPNPRDWLAWFEDQRNPRESVR